MARGIDVPAEQYAYYLTQIESLTDWQLETARVWIMRGNWQYRGNKPRLELSDFFPTPEQQQSCLAHDLRLMTSAELAAKLEAARQEGRQDERERLAKYEAEIGKTRYRYDAAQSLTDNLNAELSALRTIIARLRKSNAALVAVGVEENLNFADWYKTLNETIIKIATNENERQNFLRQLHEH